VADAKKLAAVVSINKRGTGIRDITWASIVNSGYPGGCAVPSCCCANLHEYLDISAVIDLPIYYLHKLLPIAPQSHHLSLKRMQ
jgi:hypothetical protein